MQIGPRGSYLPDFQIIAAGGMTRYCYAEPHREDVPTLIIKYGGRSAKTRVGMTRRLRRDSQVGVAT